MRIAILHNDIPPDAPPDEQDVLVQVGTVAAALGRLGHDAEAVACSLDLAAMGGRLRELRPEIVFNLVESLGGSDCLIHLPPTVLDAMGLPYTGAPAEAIFLTTQKVLAKQRLRAAGLPTPAWLGQQPGEDGYGDSLAPSLSAASPSRWIIKAVWEHASQGLDEGAVVAAGTRGQLATRLREHAARCRRQCFAEAFVEGRELNLSLLAGAAGPEVLPPAEIDFGAFPPGKPRIVDYRAKWKAGSFEYDNTPRRFDFPASDGPLLDQLGRLAVACWRLFGLRGYARVDFRVDPSGRPWILEINANPCLSPDAGFAAALGQAGISLDAAVARILADADAGACRRPPG